MLTPGQYLRKRREAARLSIHDVADQLIGLPIARRPVNDFDVGDLIGFIGQIEADEATLTALHIDLLREVYRFDKSVVVQLLHGEDVQICRRCACSWMDACITDAGACAWSAHDPLCCTACERLIAVAAETQPPQHRRLGRLARRAAP